MLLSVKFGPLFAGFIEPFQNLAEFLQILSAFLQSFDRVAPEGKLVPLQQRGDFVMHQGQMLFRGVRGFPGLDGCLFVFLEFTGGVDRDFFGVGDGLFVVLPLGVKAGKTGELLLDGAQVLKQFLIDSMFAEEAF